MNTIPTKNDYRIGAAEFVASAAKPAQFPEADRPEAAFAGRSNVGKSSLLNRLLSRRQLARISSTPGRTQTINFYDVDHKLYFVDLPGFGYAKVPLKVKAAWRPMVEGYLTSDRDIRLIILLVDIRRDPGREEADLLIWLDSLGLTAQVVATKADKVSRGQRRDRLEKIRLRLGLSDPPIAFSAITGEGRIEIWRRLDEACAVEAAPEADGEWLPETGDDPVE